MSDILEKLIGVEKKATELVAEAEAEAGRRKNAARGEAGRIHAERIQGKAKELDLLLEERKKDMARGREEENSRYGKELSAHTLRREEFARFLEPLLGIR